MTWNELKTRTITVFTTRWCPDCTRLKDRLKEQGVAFEEVDIEQDAAAARALREQTGRTAIPYVQVDGAAFVRGWHDDVPGRWDADRFLREAARAVRAHGADGAP